MSNVSVAAGLPWAENDSVRASLNRLVCLAAVLCACLCGVAQRQPYDSCAAPKAAVTAPDQRVDINHATLGELLKVPGMTPAWAGRIVHYRPYRTKQDLLEKGILSSAVYDRIKDFVIAHRDKQ
jgi:DNA uptake protein ComE-like DNA-binding protein